jgi:hypothetical protein
VSATLYLADGTKTTAGGFLTESTVAGVPEWAIFAELYAHKGAILGELAWGAPAPQLTGGVRWFRNAGAAAGTFSAGWPAGGLLSSAQGYLWQKPRAGTITPLNGLASAGGGVHLALGATGFDLQLSTTGVLTRNAADAPKLSASLNTATGLMTGSYKASTGAQSFTAIFEQPRTPEGRAIGFLLTPTGPAGVTLTLQH